MKAPIMLASTAIHAVRLAPGAAADKAGKLGDASVVVI
jgi:hypothetical protein